MNVAFQPVSDHITLSTKIVEQLKEAIARGQYGPGAKLPPERELSEVFKVSRTVVRDALKILAGTGVILVRQGVGAIVTEAGSQEAAQRLLNGGLNRKNSIRHLFEIRKVLEAEGAAWAAMRASPEDLDKLTHELQVAAKEIEIEPYDPDVHHRTNRRFHDLIARISQNDLLLDVLLNLRQMLDERRTGKRVDREWARRSIEEHTRIVTTIRSRDPEAARWAVKQHLGDVEETEVARIGPTPGTP